MIHHFLKYMQFGLFVLSILMVAPLISDVGEPSIWATPVSAISAKADETLKFPDEAPDEPLGYKSDHYRGLVPTTLNGARVLSNEQAMELYNQSLAQHKDELDQKSLDKTLPEQNGKAKFIDVMPHVPRPPNLPEGMIFRSKSRSNIPQSVWLPNVGYGQLPAEMATYFKENLEKISQGDRWIPLVFYCQEECWMSWNAAKRALEYGYKAVYWYPEGTDGWQKIGGKVVRSKPVPLPIMTRSLSN